MVPHTAVDLLRSMRDTLGDRSQLLIGIDRSKDVDRLVAAYDDTQGVTARFNLNLLDRINRELGGNVPSGRFRHVARLERKSVVEGTSVSLGVDLGCRRDNQKK